MKRLLFANTKNKSAKSAIRNDEEGYRKQFIDLVKKASSLKKEMAKEVKPTQDEDDN